MKEVLSFSVCVWVFFLCVCVCVCVRARACVSVCRWGGLGESPVQKEVETRLTRDATLFQPAVRKTGRLALSEQMPVCLRG